MNARRIFAEVIREAGRLGLAPWERLVLILAVALLIVMGREAREVLRNVKLEPQEPVDEGGKTLPGQPLDTDPDHPGGDTPSGA
jgi:hypothetical protein